MVNVFDISAYHATGGTLATYDNLEDALGTNGKNIPQSLRKGGMSVKFVQTSDNKYVQFRYMGTSTAVADFTNVNNWQGVDDEPTIGSDNLIKSGGVSKGFRDIDGVLELESGETVNKIDTTQLKGRIVQDVFFGYGFQNSIIIPLEVELRAVKYCLNVYLNNAAATSAGVWRYLDENKNTISGYSAIYWCQNIDAASIPPSNAKYIAIYFHNSSAYEAASEKTISFIELLESTVYNQDTTKEYPFVPVKSEVIDSLTERVFAVEEATSVIPSMEKDINAVNDVLEMVPVDDINKIDTRALKGQIFKNLSAGTSFANAIILPIAAIQESVKYCLNVYMNGAAATSRGVWRYLDENKNTISGASGVYWCNQSDNASIPPVNAKYVAIYVETTPNYDAIKDLSVTFIELIASSVYNQDTTKEYVYSDAKKSNVIDELEAKIEDNPYNTRYKVYGIAYNNTTGEVTRIADAVGKSNKYLVGSEYVGNKNDFDNIFPWCEIRRCNVKDSNGEKIITYEGEAEFALDGSNGEVMVEIPKFYSLRTINGNLDCICISGSPKSGFSVEPAFIDGDSELDYIYVGRYKANQDVNGVHSKSGVEPTCSVSLNTFRTNSNNNTNDFVTMLAIQKLMSIEFAEVNISRVLGGLSFIPYQGRISSAEAVTNSNTLKIKGVTDYPGADADASPVDCMWVGMRFAFADWVPGGGTPDFSALNNRTITAITDVTIENGKHVRTITFDGEPITCAENKKYVYCTPQAGGMTDSLSYHTGRCGLAPWAYGDQFHYRWIEGFIGNCGELLDGVIVKNLELAFTTNKADYGNLANYKKLAYKLPLQDNYATVVVTAMGFDRKNPLINCPKAYTEDTRQNSYYGDPVFTYENNNEYIGAWGMQLDAGCGNGLFTERFWFVAHETSPLYGTRLVMRSNL